MQASAKSRREDPTSDADKSNRIHPAFSVESAVMVDPCARLCTVWEQHLFIHHKPTFHLRVKNQRHISFFSLNFLRWDYNFEQFLFCFNNICFSVLLSSMIDGFESIRERTPHGGKRNSIFLEGKAEIFL